MTYYKVVNDRQIFSQCKSIYDEQSDIWISNPTDEQIAAAGWLPYTPPIVSPQPQMEPDYDQIVEAVKKVLSTTTEELSDEDALDVAALYPTWSSKIGEMVSAGERLWYDGKLYKVLQPHTVQEDWTPDTSTSLFVEISIEEWPDYVQPAGAQDAYNTGDRMTFNEHHYICKMDNCVWSPADYPAAWELVE